MLKLITYGWFLIRLTHYRHTSSVNPAVLLLFYPPSSILPPLPPSPPPSSPLLLPPPSPPPLSVQVPKRSSISKMREARRSSHTSCRYVHTNKMLTHLPLTYHMGAESTSLAHGFKVHLMQLVTFYWNKTVLLCFCRVCVCADDKAAVGARTQPQERSLPPSGRLAHTGTVCTVAAPDGRQNCCSIVCECSLEYLMKVCFLEIAMLLVFVYHHVWFHLL